MKEAQGGQGQYWASLSLHSELPTYLRGDILYFSLLYVLCLLTYFISADYGFYAALCLPAIAFTHALAFLSCFWSIKMKCLLRYQPRVLAEASLACVIPLPHSGSPAICPVINTNGPSGKETYFVFQKIKYVHDPATNEFSPYELPTSKSLKSYLGCMGHDANSAARGLNKFGPNVFDIPLPQFSELFMEHAVAPFFVFQMFCVLLWCLDEYWYYSLLTLVMLVMFECTVVQRRIKSLQDLREMRVPPHKVLVFRQGKWSEAWSSELLPEDIVSVVRSPHDHVVPCDVLLLSGSCVVNEALLTGESVPQLKEGAEELGSLDDTLDMGMHKRNIIFAGTKILISEAPKSSSLSLKLPPNGGAIGYVLRTGFNTEQGKLVRTILFATEHVSANNAEALLFIFILLIFAVVASAYVLLHGLQDESRSRYKLMLNCIMIITSVVPPELPMELSLAVNTSLMALVRQKIFCTEPFRIPFAGGVKVCCFDKTGTLTSDDFIVRGVAGLGENGTCSTEVISAQDTPDDVKFVIAGCHSLSHVDNTLIGDPLEKCAFEAINWSYSKADVAVPQSGPKYRLRILHRFPFSSSLKRMTCLVLPEHETGSAVRVVSKGAAEVMASHFSQVPSNYNEIHQSYARQGCRVLALGYKILPSMSPEELRNIKKSSRQEMEQNLAFAGFLVLSCPLKPSSKDAIADLIASSHRIVMITGDHVLTACHVASTLDITTKTTLVLNSEEDGSLGCSWVSVDGSIRLPFNANMSKKELKELRDEYDLCMSGTVMDAIMERGMDEMKMMELANSVAVFARTSPDQKALVLTWLKRLGNTTLMCGDGTNDVGALKQAHVGVALIGQAEQSSNTPGSKGMASKKPPAETRKQQRERRMQELRDKWDTGEVPQVRLGDASIASPFTSKVPSIVSCVNIIRQGRCTLVTTMQMYQILALNCLISAYSMSVLYLDGVKMGDTQMTVTGLCIAMFFLFVSRSKPLKKLSAERPDSQLFTPHLFVTIAGQFALHMLVLVTAVAMVTPLAPADAVALPFQNFFYSLPLHHIYMPFIISDVSRRRLANAM